MTTATPTRLLQNRLDDVDGSVDSTSAFDRPLELACALAVMRNTENALQGGSKPSGCEMPRQDDLTCARTSHSGCNGRLIVGYGHGDHWNPTTERIQDRIAPRVRDTHGGAFQ